jgi:hypothetical protein
MKSVILDRWVGNDDHQADLMDRGMHYGKDDADVNGQTTCREKVQATASSHTWVGNSISRSCKGTLAINLTRV